MLCHGNVKKTEQDAIQQIIITYGEVPVSNDLLRSDKVRWLELSYCLSIQRV